MIRKIVSLTSIGRFEALKAHGDVEFRKYTLIFADNGVGKTTLCEVIRSLQTGKSDILAGRRTLGSRTDPAAKILLTDGTVAEFRNGAWSRTPSGGVSIFDDAYIRANVHAGEVVDTAHKRNLFQVIVGAEGVRLARDVEELEKARGELNGPIRDLKKAIEAAVPAGLTLDGFLSAEPDPDIDLAIAKAETAVAAARRADELRKHKVLHTIALPSLPADFATALETSVDGVADGAEAALRRHVVHLQAQGVEAWLAKGADLLKDDACPFCSRPVGDNDLVSAFKSCFSESYRKLSETVAGLDHELSAALGKQATERIASIVASNIEAATWWNEYAEIARPADIDMDALGRAMDGLLEKALLLVRQKRDNLLVAVSKGTDFLQAQDRLRGFADSVDAYNDRVGAQNEIIHARKAELDATDPARTQAALVRLMALKRRHEPELSGRCEEYTALLGRRDSLGKQKEEAKAALDTHTTTVMGKYEKDLNGFLRKFMAGFKVVKTKAEFPRGLPSSSYRLSINDVEIDIGSENSPDDQPSFKNTLSGGDRSALALALFMAQLGHSPDMAEIAVLLDDPFQSQDAFRRNATAFQIKRAGENAKQVVVMSHDPHFLKLVWDELPPDQRKALRLHAVGATSTMSEWDIYEHLKSDHQHNISAMQRFIDDGRGAPRDVAQKLRPALEGYCKIVAYGEFGEKDMMGDIIGAVRDVGPAHVLHGVLDQLEEYNGYARRYHHATNIDADTEPLNEAELQNYTRYILELMRVRARS